MQGVNMNESSVGLVAVASPEQVNRMYEDAESEANDRQNEPVVSALSDHVRTRFTAAARAKDQDITKRLLKCGRQRMGIYESDMEQLIRDAGGSDIYMMLTDVKCRAAESWLKDVMLPAGERPFNNKST